MGNYVVFLLLFCYALVSTGSFYAGWSGIKTGINGDTAEADKARLPHDQWISQTLDHFNPTDNRVWQQRYFTNDRFSEPGGPVFLMISGESAAIPAWMVQGTWIVLAQKYKALCFLLEHRYYGKSHPTEDLSLENLVYLSIEQALADLAYFTSVMKKKHNLDTNKWIVFGGSYAGCLAAWYRMKYPHLVDGAVASSAPVKAVLDLKGYFRVVQDVLAATAVGEKCNAMIQEAVKQMELLLKDSKGRKIIEEKFRLCDTLSAGNDKDVTNLFEMLADNIGGLVQYNRDNRWFQGWKRTNITVDYLCAVMGSESVGGAVDRYAAVSNMILDADGNTCFDFKYDEMIAKLQETSWMGEMFNASRQWIYQMCSEFGFFQSSDDKNQPFGHRFPLSFFVQLSTDIFGAKFNLTLLQQGVNRTNLEYGGRGLKVTKVVFPNGSLDPWHILGITQDLSPEATAVFIHGAAHCADMYPATPEDLPQLTAAREYVGELVGKWIA